MSGRLPGPRVTFQQELIPCPPGDVARHQGTDCPPHPTQVGEDRTFKRKSSAHKPPFLPTPDHPPRGLLTNGTGTGPN